jgi:hypothetical protein
LKTRSLLASLALTAAAALPIALAPTASAATTTQLRVVDAYTYQAGNPFDHTVCLDGTSLTSLSTTQTTGPFTVDTGAHTVTVFNTLDALCSGEPEFTFAVTVPAGPASTLMLYWPFDSSMQAVVLPDDLTCVAAGQGRVVLRNGGAWGGGSQTIDLRGTPPAGTDTVLVGGVASGAQGSADLAAGSYTNAAITLVGDTATQTTPGPLTVADGEETIVYGYGGVDGSSGTFTATLPLDTCTAPTTTVAPTSTVAPTASTTTSPPAATAATPVAAQPTFTG